MSWAQEFRVSEVVWVIWSLSLLLTLHIDEQKSDLCVTIQLNIALHCIVTITQGGFILNNIFFYRAWLQLLSFWALFKSPSESSSSLSPLDLLIFLSGLFWVHLSHTRFLLAQRSFKPSFFCQAQGHLSCQTLNVKRWPWDRVCNANQTQKSTWVYGLGISFVD